MYFSVRLSGGIVEVSSENSYIKQDLGFNPLRVDYMVSSADASVGVWIDDDCS
ncbi:MAG: hypothetical protein HRU38_12275 [Saccharospirillaceae bacterium]|nr:hypothetical protein [Pseudomonadales bacterium]NRB79424.1 hypothetical protein [Saccharospirillaceae bacterium]